MNPPKKKRTTKPPDTEPSVPALATNQIKQVGRMMDRRVEDMHVEIEMAKRRTLARQAAGVICFIGYIVLLALDRIETAELTRMLATGDITVMPAGSLWHLLGGQMPGVAGLALLAPEALDSVGNLLSRVRRNGGKK